MGDFELDTRFEPISELDEETDSQRFRLDLSSDWEIWGPNGGYMAAIALRAAGAIANVQRPASVTTHFLSVATFDEVEIHAQAVKRGRRAESLRVTILQHRRPVLDAMIRTAAEVPGYVHDTTHCPEVPAADQLKSMEELRPEEESPYPFWNNLESRPVDPDRWLSKQTVRPPTWCEWFRFRPRATFDDPFLDAARSLLLVDTMIWPAASEAHTEGAFVAPSLDATAWFHCNASDSEWLLGDHEAPIAQGGLIGGNARIWSQDGRLVATGGAQLMCVPAQPPG